ncbi:MAG: PQQ-binding-like beta-propeller repeat protein [Phycisphaerae bacterium]
MSSGESRRPLPRGNTMKYKWTNMKTQMYRVGLAVVAVLSLATVVSAEEPPKITHDWPGYTGPDGTYADQSKVPILDDLSRAKLLWISEHEDMGYGKTSSKRGHAYGGKSHPSGSVCPIVAGGLVIAGYFNPQNNVVADDVILAVDAATGKTKWKQVFPGKGYNLTASKHVQYGPTLTAADGKVFHLGSGGRIYCVELATGKPLWESDLGDYPETFKTAAEKIPVTDNITEGVGSLGGRPLYLPLIVIDGVLMVPCQTGLFAYDTATGKELWKQSGEKKTPSPAKINDVTYALCSGGDANVRLVEPRTGKVLWTENIGASLATSDTISYIVADGRLFIPYNKEVKGPEFLSVFTLSETGAKLLWQSQDKGVGDYFSYRDGVIYTCTPEPWSLKSYRAEDGTRLSNPGIALWGAHFQLWGDRLIAVGDDCHESIGHYCTYQSITPGTSNWKFSGQPLMPRSIRQYVGVGGYQECWMRPAFADGLIFTRSVNKENGKGAILCWDLRTRPNSKMVKFQMSGLLQGHPTAQNLVNVEAEVEAGNITHIFTMLQMRAPTASGFETVYVKGIPRVITPLVSGRWKGAVDVELLRDGETWQFDLDNSGATPSTYQRVISALAKPIDVEGIADAAEMAPDPKAKKPLPENAKQWIINLKQAACPETNGPLAKRRDMYIVLTRFANGEQEAFARARSLNISTHEVQVGSFAADDKTLTLKGTVLFHSDKYVNPSDQRGGTVALDVDVTLTGDGKNWKGTYKGQYGAAWTGSGTVSKQR